MLREPAFVSASSQWRRPDAEDSHSRLTDHARELSPNRGYRRYTGHFHQLISCIAACAVLPFALRLGIALFIASEHIFGSTVGLTTGYFFVLLPLMCWYALQYLRWLRTGHKEWTIFLRQRTVTEGTPLDQRIAHMLTEGRVVLPGVQGCWVSSSSPSSANHSRSCQPARR
jgi:hypothetical protein